MFALAGQQEGHAAEQGHVVAHEVGEHRVPFLRPPCEQAADPERGDPDGRDQGVGLVARRVQRDGNGSVRPASDPAERQGQRMPQKIHDPRRRGEADEQREKQGDEVGVGVAQQGAREKARRKRGEDARAESGFHAAHAPRPEEDEQGHEARHERRQPEGHLRRFGAGEQGENAQQFGHGVSGAEFETFGSRDPVVGVVRRKEHFVAEAVFHFLPRRPFLKPQQKGHGIGRHPEQEAEQPARNGPERDVSGGGCCHGVSRKEPAFADAGRRCGGGEPLPRSGMTDQKPSRSRSSWQARHRPTPGRASRRFWGMGSPHSRQQA